MTFWGHGETRRKRGQTRRKHGQTRRISKFQKMDPIEKKAKRIGKPCLGLLMRQTLDE